MFILYCPQLVPMQRPSPSSNRRSPSPHSKRSAPANPPPLSIPAQPSGTDLIALNSTAKKQQPEVDLLTGLPSPPPTQPSQGTSALLIDPRDPQNVVKDSIMSLYSSQPVRYSYTAQGMPVNAYFYQQQQAAAMRMAQQQYQVQQVQNQMEQLKVRRQGQPVAVGNGTVPSTASGGGQTLNPHLW